MKNKLKPGKLTLTLMLWTGVFFIVIGFFFSCGFVSNNAPTQVSFADSKGSDGVFKSPEGPLDSEDKCFRNKSCVELCDSMLKSFSDQKRCYNQTETAVQSFRDIYNLLAIGNSKKLEQITPKAMEAFLVFGPALWRDAIYGFERGRKENCEVNDGSDDPRQRENCKFENYYKQPGYDGKGAGTVLSWIARNNWLAKLLEEHDEDKKEVMTALLDILSTGGPTESSKCPIESGDFAFSFSGIGFSFSLSKDRKIYQSFGNSDCVDKKSYFYLAHKEKNHEALAIGYDVLKTLCKKADITTENACEIYFFCKIENQEEILLYLNSKKLLKGFDVNQSKCPG